MKKIKGSGLDDSIYRPTISGHFVSREAYKNNIAFIKDGELREGDVEKLEMLGFNTIVYKNKPPKIFVTK